MRKVGVSVRMVEGGEVVVGMRDGRNGGRGVGREREEKNEGGNVVVMVGVRMRW